jgi:hypothetical protein
MDERRLAYHLDIIFPFFALCLYLFSCALGFYTGGLWGQTERKFCEYQHINIVTCQNKSSVGVSVLRIRKYFFRIWIP